MNRRDPETLHLPRSGGTTRLAQPVRAIVAGGGIAGVAAAAVLAERGAQVTLIEKEYSLGGRAGGFPLQLSGGTQVDMERGFHAFFRQYYNLRALLRRIDPSLSFLERLDDYPILGPEGRVQTFRDLPTRTPWQVMALTWRSPHLRLLDLLGTNPAAALEMMRYEEGRTFAEYDGISAARYLDSLQFPEMPRRMLFDVFAHSSFNPEADMSAAEMLMMFHFYFTGNPEGLVFDAARRPMSQAIWSPFAERLRAQGATLRLGCAVEQVESDGACWRVRHSGGSDEADLLVIALDVGSLQRVVAASSALTPLQARTLALKPTWPFAVWRLWLDRRVAPSRPVFAGITGIGLLDSIAVYDHLQDESIAWARAQGGSVVEMHAYAVPPQHDQAYIRADMLAGLHRMYPETRQAKIVDQCFLLRNDCPAYPPGQSHLRPQVATKWPTLALAGDFVAVPVPSALMERAATSGFLAANTLLAPLGVAPEPIRSVPRLGLFAPRPKPAQGGERTVRRDRGLHLRRSAELWLAGRPAAPAETIDARPDWQQAAPAWIATALAHSQALPGGGWYVLDATRAIGDRPRRLWVCGQRLVVWRAGGAVHAAPDRCPHMGAELSRGCVRDGRLICPWHGLALGPDGHGTWRPLPSYDDGLFIWVRLDGDEAPTATPVLVPRPAGAIAATVRFEVACDPCDVIANRLDPWHGAHLHPQSFAALRLVERKESEITVRAAFRLLGRLAIECDARFYCADPRHIVMTLVQGEGVGSMMETHVTPIAPGRSVINEAVLATSDRTGFRIARQLAARWIGRSLQAAAMRLWREDAPYAERLYALRQVSHM